MNPFNSNYLFDGRQQLSNLLIELITGSMDIFSEDQSLNTSINNLSSQLYRDTNPKRYQIFLENKFDEMIVYTMDISRRRGNSNLLMSVLELLIIITNNSEEFVVALMKTRLPELLINDTISLSRSRSRQEALKFIDLYLIIIFNIIRHHKCRQYFQHYLKIEKFKESLLPFVTMDFGNLKVNTFIVLAFLNKGDNKDKNVILHHSDTIDLIHEYLSNALKSEDKTYLGLDVWELLLGLQALSTVTTIRIKMVKIKGFVATIIAIVSSGNSKSREVTVALEILQNLCINENIRKWLIEKLNIDLVVERLRSSTESSIKTNAESLLGKLRQSGERNSKAVQETCATVTNPINISEEDSLTFQSSADDTLINASMETIRLDNIDYDQDQIPTTDESDMLQDNYDKWDKNEVSEWLITNKLSEKHSKFVDFDGSLLKSIKKMKKATPDVYYKHLKSTLELSFVEILRLDSALEKLAE